MLYGEKIKTGLEKVKYCFYVMTHPFDGFWGIRREGKGSIPVAIAFVLLTILTLTIEKQSTGFLFNHNRLSELNVLVDIITVAMVYVLWCVANWCTHIPDGRKGEDAGYPDGSGVFSAPDHPHPSSHGPHEPRNHHQ